jgi:hypothetical protein
MNTQTSLPKNPELTRPKQNQKRSLLKRTLSFRGDIMGEKSTAANEKCQQAQSVPDATNDKTLNKEPLVAADSDDESVKGDEVWRDTRS